MIFTLGVAVDLAIAVFAIIIGVYTAFKAFKIEGIEKNSGADVQYEAEKNFHLISTVGWMTLISRIFAIPLFFITVISLIPSVPGAMCEFGVLQAGSPYSWIDFGLKLTTVFLFGGWLFIDYANKKLTEPKLMGTLARGFILLLPFLFVDAFLDIAFFGSLEPLVVPCCMVAYAPNTFFSCPFCLVTFQMPLLMGAIPAFALSAAFIIWSKLLKGFSHKHNVPSETSPIMSKALMLSVILAVIGTALIIIQVIITLIIGSSAAF